MIIANAGGKGGVGKSTLSWNLGSELDAVVVDLDLATADLPPGRGPDLHDVLAGRATPMEAVQEVQSVALVPSGRTLAGARASNLSELPEALEYLDKQFGRVIVDCPAGLARDVGVALNAAHVTTIVTTSEKPAIVDAMKTRDLAREIGAPIACVAINRVQSSNVESLVDEVERDFSAPGFVVPEDQAVAEAQSNWRPVRHVEPEGEAVAAIEAISERLEACEQRSNGRPEQH